MKLNHLSPRLPWATHRDLSAALLMTISLFLLIIFEPSVEFLSPVRFLIGLVYVLFIPGYCLAAAMFARAGDLDAIERVGLSVGLSIAWASILALVLDQLVWGLALWPIVIAEAISIAMFSVVALWQRSDSSGQYAAGDLPWHPRSWWTALPNPDRRTVLMVSAALAVAGFSMAWVFLVPSSSEVTTEFYMLGNDGQAQNFPRQATLTENLIVTIGLTNREQTRQRYRVEVWVEDPWIQDRRALVAEAGPFVLVDGKTQEWPVAWQMPWMGLDQKVEFLLFTDDSTTPYRRLRFFLDVREEIVAIQ